VTCGKKNHISLETHTYVANGYVVHNSGKDKTMINVITKEAYKRVGAYYYVFPTYTQGKKIIWEGMDRGGMRFLEHIPEAIRAGVNNTEMKIHLKNGSLIQIVGSENIDSLVGTNPVGVVYSEYSLQKQKAWDIIRPILAENNGWAWFAFTPRGQNHAYDLLQMAQENPEWVCEVLTVKDTGAIPMHIIDQELASGMPQDLIDQEFFCSFLSSIPGAYFADQMRWLTDNNHIGIIPINSDLPLYTCWDIGYDDSMAIWTFKKVSGEYHMVDYYENSGKLLEHYLDYLQVKTREYVAHMLPHDAAAHRAAGKSFVDDMGDLGVTNVMVAPRPMLKEIAIEAARRLLPRCWFSAANCSKGIQALREYCAEYDEDKKVKRMTPLRNWATHGADSFQTLAMLEDTKGRGDIDMDKVGV
jgi:phage terminase large subunit